MKAASGKQFRKLVPVFLSLPQQQIQKRMFYPNLIIAGLPKCGTTSLQHWLSQHPEICAGIEYEIRFLMDEGQFLSIDQGYHQSGLAGWVNHFPDKGRGDFKIWFDCTPMYYNQNTAIQAIQELNDKPSIAIVFRRPSDRIYSLYQYAKYDRKNIRDDLSFEAFVAESRKEAEGEFRDMPSLHYSSAKYDEIVAQWKNIVGPENFVPIIFDDMKSDPIGAAKRVTSRFELDQDAFEHINYSIRNETVKRRSRTLRRLRARFPQTVGIPQRLKEIGRRAIEKIDAAPIDRSEKRASAELRSKLDLELSDMIDRFSDSIDQDMSHWYK